MSGMIFFKLPALSVFFAFLLLPIAAQEDSTKNFTDENGHRQGYWEQRYPNGNLRYSGQFRNDRPVGEFTRYFSSGNKMAFMVFCDQGIRADTKLYYENGKIAAKGIYLDEKKDSVWRYYSFYDQHLTSTETYDAGVRDGISAVYYPNGNYAEVFTYRNDQRHGWWKQYYADGSVKVMSEFSDDMRHGDFVYYSPGGRKEIEGRYYRNRMHGEWFFFNERGEVISQIKYTDGVAENEDELIEKQQEEFRIIEKMRGKIPEPDESELFLPGGRR